MQDQALSASALAVRVGALVVLAALLAGALPDPVVRAQTTPAFFLRSLQDPSERREARPDILDTPILPGSVIKAVTLVAALESQVIEPDTSRICRRVVTIDGRRYTCSHPDLKRPLRPAEALAHSCNDFFVSLAARLPRSALNDLRTRLGLAPVDGRANLAASLVGLDGPRITPRALLDVIARLAGADRQRPVAISNAARRVLLEGLRGAADYGSAQALGTSRVSALAKTGTAPMPGGSWMGLVVALEPADAPTRGIVVVAPGAAGLDAAAIAADLLADGGPKGPPLLRSPALSPTPAPDRRSGGSDPSTSVIPSVPERPLLPSSATIRIGVTNVNGSTRVTQFNLEDYVAQVVAGEGQPRALDAAQQALAITARTFALANRNRHRRESYDLCDTTHCQVLRRSTESTRRAAAATAGRVLVSQGQPASVFYSAWCGGRSELASDVWPGALNYAESSHQDDACRDEPGWTSEVGAGEIERALRAAGHRGDRLRDLRVLQRNASGRVARMRAEGFTPNELSGHDFRMAVGRAAGWQRMKSTAFDVRRTGAGYRFTGRGFGHGVGLCVIGAGHRAAAGTRVDEILQFYFPALRLEMYRGATLTAANRRPGATRPGAPEPAPGDVLIALPAAEEADRTGVVQLIRAARDAIAAKAGLTPPDSIRVTVHPTVDAFGRASGQPWWVSGATDGATIELLPLTILRQQGQLERTIRHEVAHVLLDAALSRRPLWVREGAAFYFADPGNSSEPTGRTSCPPDEEFLRPMSAGAHRNAYARAEACFRRAVAGGRRWQEVK